MPLPLAGAKIKASDFSSIFPLGVDAWTDYIPSLTQSGAVTKTVTTAKYSRVGRLITVEFALAITGTGTANNSIQMGLPVTASAAAINATATGKFFFIDQSTGQWYTGVCGPTTGGNAAIFIVGGNSTATLGQTGGGFTAALANADSLRGSLEYEAAT